MGGRRGRRIEVGERCKAVMLIDEAVQKGARLFKACEVIEIHPRTYRRWRDNSTGDNRRGPLTEPANKLSTEERDKIIETAISKEYKDLPPSKIVPGLADKGIYIGSEMTFYRVLKQEKMLKHRGKTKPRTHKKPPPLTASGPNQVWSWDITYFLTTVRGIFFYAYIFIDIYSRKIVAGEVFESESNEYASRMMREACFREGVRKDDLNLHSDNGSPMKGATLLATLQNLGVVPSFSRPRVSDDNPYSEALFRTLKYCPEFPSKPFESLEVARSWLKEFIDWYNNYHLHSGIKFVTPADRHAGRDIEILKRREEVYKKAKEKNPERWSGSTRNWTPAKEVYLNPLKNNKEDDMKKAA